MLRVAIPNKGSLAEDSIAVLKEAGYKQRTDSRDLVLVDTQNQVEFYFTTFNLVNNLPFAAYIIRKPLL